MIKYYEDSLRGGVECMVDTIVSNINSNTMTPIRLIASVSTLSYRCNKSFMQVLNILLRHNIISLKLYDDAIRAYQRYNFKELFD